MATRQSENYDLTLQDNDEFIDIETTAENFRKLDEILKELDDEIESNSEKITELNNNGYAHPTYTARSSGLYKITVDSTGHVKAATKATKADITALGIPSVNTVYSHPTYTARNSGLYKITVDGTGHVSSVTAVTKDDITALGIPAQDTTYTHPVFTAQGSGLYKITVNSNGHVTAATKVTKDDITALGIPGENTDTDTKNTAGSTDTSDKIYLIGAKSQGANPQTYSHDTAYIGADGCVYSGGKKVVTDVSGIESDIETLESSAEVANSKIEGLESDVSELKNYNGVGSEVLTNKTLFNNFDTTSSTFFVKNLDKYKMVLVRDTESAVHSPVLASVTGNGTYYFIEGGFSYFWDRNSDGALEECNFSYFARVRASDNMVVTSQYCEDGSGVAPGFSLEIIGLF